MGLALTSLSASARSTASTREGEVFRLPAPPTHSTACSTEEAELSTRFSCQRSVPPPPPLEAGHKLPTECVQHGVHKVNCHGKYPHFTILNFLQLINCSLKVALAMSRKGWSWLSSVA